MHLNVSELVKHERLKIAGAGDKLFIIFTAHLRADLRAWISKSLFQWAQQRALG